MVKKPATMTAPTNGENWANGEFSPMVKTRPGSMVKMRMVKNLGPLVATTKDFSPSGISPTRGARVSPKPAQKMTDGEKSRGVKGRPRNPELPPSPGPYMYWQKSGNGLKLERRNPYEYLGFIMPNEWAYLRGNYDEEYILRCILAAIRIKRSKRNGPAPGGGPSPSHP